MVASARFEIVVLPAPEGAETMKRIPSLVRRATSMALFDVLDLLADLLHLALGVDRELRQPEVARLGGHGVDLAADLLEQELDLLADRLVGRAEVAKAGEMALQPHDLLGDVALLGLKGGFLQEPALVDRAG